MTDAPPSHSSSSATTALQAMHALVREAEQLLSTRPTSHKLQNEYSAVLLLQTTEAREIEYCLPMARRCLERMRITVETGTYPEHLMASGRARFAAVAETERVLG